MEKNDEQTIDEAWRKQMGALCAGFQKSQGEMIIVASQPSRPLFACCTTKVKKQMLRHFSTFKECLKISNNLGSPSVNPCCLCFNVPEKDDVRDCEVEDVWSALGIKVPRGGKVCVDCSDNLHKFLYFKKKITAIHVKKKLATKRKTGTATQENVKNKVFNGVKASEAVTGQAEKDSGESHEHLSEIETFSDIEMADITEESDQKANIDKGHHQEQNSLSADTEVQSDAESFLSEIKEEGTFEDESLISSSQDQSKLSLGVNTGGLGGVDTQTTPILRSALCSTLPPNKMTTPPTPNIKTEVSLSSTPQTASSMFSMVFFGDPKNYCLVQHPPGSVPLANNQVIQQPSPIGSVPLTNNQVLKQTPPIVSVPLANNQVLKETPPIGSVPLTNNQVLKQTPPIVSVPLTNNQVLKQTPPIVSVPLTNNQVLKQSPPTVFVPRVKSEVIQQPLPLGSVPLANNQVGMQPPPIGSIPLANNQILIRPPLIGSPMMANNQVLIQPPAMFPQIGGALILATQGVGAVLPAPISSSSSKMQKTTTYVPILSKKPPSPQITQIGTTQVPANSTIGTMPAPQDDSVSAPSTTKSVNPTPNPLPPKLSNLEESKEKAVIAFKNAVLSQAAPLPSPMPSAFILALPKSLETSTPNIQIITNSTSTFQSKTTTPLVVPSTAGNLAEQGLMPLTVTDISKHSPQGHSVAARRQTVAPTHFTKQQKNTSSRGNSSLLKIGKMTYQLVSKNNKCFLVPSLQPGSDEKRNGSSKRKSTSEHPEKGFPKKKLKPSDIKARLEAMIEFSESESEPEEIEAEEDKKLARLEQEVNSPAPATDHDYTVRNADIPGVNCRRCPFSAAYWKTMAGHMRVHHLKRYCIKCNHFLKNSFPPHACTRSALKKTRKHVCLVCSKLIDNAGDLYKHYQVHHKTEIEQEGHCHSLYNSVRPQNVFICKGCLRVEFSEHNMLCHVKKAHMSDGEEDLSGHLLLKNEPICVCPVCWLHFPEKKFLDFHIEVFHVRKPGTELVCHLCSEVFTSKSDLIDHYSTHWCDIKYRCGICRQQTDPMSSLEELRSHRNAFHPTNSLTATLLCPIENCEKTYQEDTEFLQHITQHELENKCTQKCSKCSFTAISTTLMTKHEERFHYEPNKRCSICTKRLKSSAALTAHMDRHAREGDPEMFMCEKCGSLSSTRSQHRKHMQKHQYKNQKPRSCQECGENYSLARDLAMHILKCHPEVKDVRVPTQFPCIYCDYITFSSLDFRRHMTSHNRVKPYRCDFCERGFRDGDIFNQHVKQHKEGRNNRMFRCFVCHLDRERGEMRKHLKAESHKLNCQLGGLNFEDYNKDLLKLFPSRVSALLDRKNYAEKSLKEECRRVHEEHCKRAEGQMEGEERSYTVYTPEGEELLIEVPTKHPQCPECGLLFKTEEQLSEHKEYVRHLDTVATRNEFRCQVCDIYLFGRLSVAEHARCQHHRDVCLHQGLRPEDILDVYKIPQDFYDNSKKEVKSYGYKCVVCDVFFATKSSKKSHISKPGHVEKCQELGLDPADGDRFEDYSHEAKMLKKKKQDRPKLLTKPKVEGEKTINRLVKKLFTINLLGMEVPRNVAFSCLVCDITVSNRVQAIDHLHMPRHIANCEDKGTLSGPGNLCLQLKMEDYTSAVGKTVSQILGLPSDAIFPLTEEEKSLHIKQIKEAEASSGGIIKKIKGQQDSSLECLVNCVQPAVSSENHGQPSISSPNVAVPVSLYRSILNSSVPIKQKAGLQRIGLQKIQRLPVLKKNNVPHKDKAPKQTQNASLRGTLAPRQAQTEGPMSDREDKATSVDSLAEEVIEMSNASSNVFPAVNAEDVSVDSL